MDRKKFFRNAIGAVVATVVGSKLDWVPGEPSFTSTFVGGMDPALPGIEPSVMRVFFPKDWFHKFDILSTGSTGEQWFVSEEIEDHLICQSVMKPDRLLEICFNPDNATHAADHVRVMSAIREYDTNKTRQSD